MALVVGNEGCTLVVSSNDGNDGHVRNIKDFEKQGKKATNEKAAVVEKTRVYKVKMDVTCIDDGGLLSSFECLSTGSIQSVDEIDKEMDVLSLKDSQSAVPDPKSQDKNSGSKVIAGQKEGGSGHLGPPTNSPETPVRRRENTRKRERESRCASVGAFIEPPFNIAMMDTQALWRVSMFELSTDGWIIDKIRDGHRCGTKTLNLDEDINTILKNNAAAIVSLGNIKLRF